MTRDSLRCVHLKRVWLAPTETFVHTQVRLVERTDVRVVARDLVMPQRFPDVTVWASAQHIQGATRPLGNLAYRFLRLMLPRERRLVSQAIDDMRPDVLHGHYAVDSAYFAPVIQRASIPIVVSCYGYDVSSFPHRYRGLGRVYIQLAWKLATIVLAMSEDMRRDIVALGCPPEKIRIHYHGIDLSRFPMMTRPSREDRTRVLFVGSLGDERKGVPDMLRAFASAARERPRLELRLVGDGRFRERYEHLAEILGIGRHTSFTGFVAHDQLHQEFEAADIFCHPSLTTASHDKEGIPGTIVEAMASGLPIVATRHAGIPSMVIDGEHGILSAERDIAGLSASLVSMADDADTRRRLGTAASRRAHECADARRQTARLEALYEEVVTNARNDLRRP